jgi:hypothetical protein
VRAKTKGVAGGHALISSRFVRKFWVCGFETLKFPYFILTEFRVVSVMAITLRL